MVLECVKVYVICVVIGVRSVYVLCYLLLMYW